MRIINLSKQNSPFKVLSAICLKLLQNSLDNYRVASHFCSTSQELLKINGFWIFCKSPPICDPWPIAGKVHSHKDEWEASLTSVNLPLFSQSPIFMTSQMPKLTNHLSAFQCNNQWQTWLVQLGFCLESDRQPLHFLYKSNTPLHYYLYFATRSPSSNIYNHRAPHQKTSIYFRHLV